MWYSFHGWLIFTDWIHYPYVRRKYHISVLRIYWLIFQRVQTRGTQNDAVTATLAWSLQLKALSNFQDPDPLLETELRFTGKIIDCCWFRRTWRFLMSLSSISVGNFTIPNMNKYQRGLDDGAFFRDISDLFPTLLTEEFLSMVSGGEFETGLSFL